MKRPQQTLLSLALAPLLLAVTMGLATPPSPTGTPGRPATRVPQAPMATSCDTLTGLALGINTPAAPTLSWNASPTAERYFYRYRIQDSSTYTTSSASATTTTVTLSGLNPIYLYEVEAWVDCGDSASAISSPLTLDPYGFARSGTINTFPYTESFEDSLGQWAQADTTDALDWVRSNAPTPTDSTGPAAASSGSHYLHLEGDDNEELTAQLYTVVDLTGQSSAYFSVDYHLYGNTMGTLALRATTNGQDYQTLASFSENLGNQWQSVTVNLSPYAGSTVVLLLQGTAGGGAKTDMALDNLRIVAGEGSPLCSTPTGIAVNNICLNQATLAWEATDSPIPPRYTYRYRLQGALAWTTASSTASSVTLTGLAQDTTYQWQVRCEEDAADGDTLASPFTTISSFSTITLEAPMAVGNDTLYQCQGETVAALTATASPSAIPHWYRNAALTDLAGTGTTLVPDQDGNTPGTFTYYVTQRLDTGSVSCESVADSITLQIHPLPSAPLPTADTLFVCQGNAAAVQLQATGQVGATYYWYNLAGTVLDTTVADGSGITSTTAHGLGPNSAPGLYTYQVRQEVANTGTLCLSPAALVAIDIEDLPAAPAVANVAYCVGDTVAPLFATTEAGALLIWLAADGTVLDTAATLETSLGHSAPIGTYTYRCYQIAPRGGGLSCPSDTATLTLSIVGIPSAPIVPSTAYAYCQGETPNAVQATSTGTNRITWYRDSLLTDSDVVQDGQALIPDENALSAAGTYDYYATQTLDTLGIACQSPATRIAITLVPQPSRPAINQDTLYVCQGDAGTLPATAITESAPGATFFWFDALGDTLQHGTGTTFSAYGLSNSTLPGVYRYSLQQQLTSEGLLCLSPAVPFVVWVQPRPAAPFVANLPSCQGSPIDTLRATGEAGALYVWLDSTGAVLDSSFTGTLATGFGPNTPPGTYNYQVYQKTTRAGGLVCLGDTSLVSTTIVATPTVPSNALYTYCQGEALSPMVATGSGSGVLYRWYQDEALTILLAEGAVLQPRQSRNAAPGDYLYYLNATTPEGCVSPTAIHTVRFQETPERPLIQGTSTTDRLVTITYCQDLSIDSLVLTNYNPAAQVLWFNETDSTTDTLATASYLPPVSTEEATDQFFSVQQRLGNCNSTTTRVRIIVYPFNELLFDLYPGNPTQICQDQGPWPLQASPQPNPAANEVAYFTIDGDTAIGEFNPATLAEGPHVVKYLFFDQNTGCADSVTRNISVNPVPEARFSLGVYCSDTPLQFTNLTTLRGVAADTAEFESWYWTFGDGFTSTQYAPTHTYRLPQGFTQSTVTVSLTATTKSGCQHSFSQDYIISLLPQLQVTWANSCQGEEVGYTPTVTLGGADSITQVLWRFGDGDTLLADTLGPVGHSFANPGQYTTTLSLATRQGCMVHYATPVFVVPSTTLNAGNDIQLSDFSTSTQGWAYGLQNGSPLQQPSWQHGTLASPALIDPESGFTTPPQVWVAGNDSTFQENEISYLYSHCYNLQALERPTFTMRAYINLDEEKDGLSVEYLTGNGSSWQTLGRQGGEGSNWYNGNYQPDPTGGRFDGWTDSLGWFTAGIRLDDVLDASGLVRFRIKLHTDGNRELEEDPQTTGNKVILGQVSVGNRSRLVFMEHFTSAQDPAAVITTAEAAYAQFISQYGEDLLPLRYHVAFPAADSFNLRNTADPQRRFIHYRQVNQQTGGWLVLNGRYVEGTSSVKVDSLAGVITTQAVQPPVVDLEAALGSGNSPGTLELTLSLTALRRLNQGTRRLFVAVAEPAAPGGYELVKLLPDAPGQAPGQLYTQAWNQGDQATQTITWQVEQAEGMTLSPSVARIQESQLTALVFVQDMETGEVLRAKAFALDAKTVDQALYGGVTGGLLNLQALGGLRLWPNPASRSLHLALGKPAPTPHTWQLSTLQGQVISQGHWPAGRMQHTLAIEGISAGMYLFTLQSPSGHSAVRRFMVQH